MMSPNLVPASEPKPSATGDKEADSIMPAQPMEYQLNAPNASPDKAPMTLVTPPSSKDQSISTPAEEVASGTSVPTSPRYASGQIVGFKAGLNIHTTGSSRASVPNNLLTQDAAFNQGVHAGFEAGQGAQKASPSGRSSAAYTQGQLAGFQTAVAQHHQAGINIEKTMSSILGGNQQYNEGVKSGFQAGFHQQAQLGGGHQVEVSGGQGASAQAGVQAKQNTGIVADKQVGIEAGHSVHAGVAQSQSAAVGGRVEKAAGVDRQPY